MDKDGWLSPDETLHFHVEPFEGANLEPAALALRGLTQLTLYVVLLVSMKHCMPFLNGTKRDESDRL